MKLKIFTLFTKYQLAESRYFYFLNLKMRLWKPQCKLFVCKLELCPNNLCRSKTKFYLLTLLLISNYLLLDRAWDIAIVVLLVAQLWLKAGFANSFLNLFIGKTVWRSGGTYYVLFDHNTAKIIGA
jgi:hypothetical protein